MNKRRNLVVATMAMLFGGPKVLAQDVETAGTGSRLPTERLDYEASCRRLHQLGFTESEYLPKPGHRPQYDDEEPLGVNFFRTTVTGDLSDLTLPRTFFGRSEIRQAFFRNTDLEESNLCWNDFTDVDFTSANLSRCDMRASLFERVLFDNCELGLADLRRSSFVGCSFKGASMKGTVLAYEQKNDLSLSDVQISEIAWMNDPGEEPAGG